MPTVPTGHLVINELGYQHFSLNVIALMNQPINESGYKHISLDMFEIIKQPMK